MPMLPSRSSTVPQRPAPGTTSKTDRWMTGRSARRAISTSGRGDVDAQGTPTASGGLADHAARSRPHVEHRAPRQAKDPTVHPVGAGEEAGDVDVGVHAGVGAAARRHEPEPGVARGEGDLVGVETARAEVPGARGRTVWQVEGHADPAPAASAASAASAAPAAPDAPTVASAAANRLPGSSPATRVASVAESMSSSSGTSTTVRPAAPSRARVCRPGRGHRHRHPPQQRAGGLTQPQQPEAAVLGRTEPRIDRRRPARTQLHQEVARRPAVCPSRSGRSGRRRRRRGGRGARRDPPRPGARPRSHEPRRADGPVEEEDPPHRRGRREPSGDHVDRLERVVDASLRDERPPAPA